MSWQPLSRRAVLRGSGLALALPWLEAMMPRKAKATGFPTRFMSFYVPNGIFMQRWVPPTTGPGYALSPLLHSLADLKNDFLVLGNVANPAAFTPDALGGNHSCGLSSMLTVTPPKLTTGSDVEAGISIDQIMANALRGKTRFASLELGSTLPEDTPAGEVKWSSIYVRHIAWTGPTTPLPKELNARAAFDRLFASARGSSAPNKSVLDYVMNSTARLQRQLGTSDRQKLDSYLTAVREVETRVGVALPVGDDAQISADMHDLPAQVKSMLDVIALAFQTDSTRVITYMFGDATSVATYGFLGLTDPHHFLSHHGGDLVKLEKIFSINQWEVQQLGYLLRKLKAMPEGDGSVLDHSMIYFSSEVADGDHHNHDDLPIIVAGRGGGAFSPGRHIRYADAPPLANLYASFFQAMGLPQTTLAGQPVTPLGQLSG
jgi:hypothetical protein